MAWRLMFDGAQLVGQSSGEGDGLVFLHAGVADRRSWAESQSEMSATHHAVSYDRRGFGETNYEEGSFSHLDDLRAVLDHQKIKTVTLVGNSMGGGLALDFALASPERCRGLVLIGTAVSGAPPPKDMTEPLLSLDAALDAADEAGDLEAVNRLEAHLWLDGPTGPEGRVTGEVRDLFLAMNGGALAAPSPGDERPRPPAFDRLGDIAIPTLVLVGSLDLPFIIERSALIADLLPQGEFLEMAGVAHLPAMERPDLFVPVLEGFVRRL